MLVDHVGIAAQISGRKNHENVCTFSYSLTIHFRNGSQMTSSTHQLVNEIPSFFKSEHKNGIMFDPVFPSKLHKVLRGE
jgi:hypothetical protein